jgi:hypothetical protein
MDIVFTGWCIVKGVFGWLIKSNRHAAAAIYHELKIGNDGMRDGSDGL